MLLRHYPFDTSDLCKTLSNKILYSLNFEELLDSSQRIIELELLENGFVKVITTKILNYIYLSENYRIFEILFEATKQQAESFKIKKLIINNTDYTSQLDYNVTQNLSRGQFVYKIQSNHIKIPTVSSKIYYKCSYIVTIHSRYEYFPLFIALAKARAKYCTKFLNKPELFTAM